MIGRLVVAPELKEVRDGMFACRMRIATEHVQKGKDGQTKKDVCFIDTTAWGTQAQLCAKYLVKGSTVAVEGRLKEEKWTDKTTQVERSKHVIVAENIVFMDAKTTMANTAEAIMPKAAAYQATLPNIAPGSAPKQEQFTADFDDSLPF